MTNEPYVPEGEPYSPKPQDCTVEMMNKIIDAANFMKNQDRLFRPSVKE